MLFTSELFIFGVLSIEAELTGAVFGSGLGSRGDGVLRSLFLLLVSGTLGVTETGFLQPRGLPLFLGRSVVLPELPDSTDLSSDRVTGLMEGFAGGRQNMDGGDVCCGRRTEHR